MRCQNLVAILLFQSVLAAGTLHLKTRTVDTTDLVSDYQSGPETSWRAGTSHYLLQFRSPVSDDDRNALAALGAIVTGVVPDNAVIVSAPDGFSTDGLDLEYAGRLRGGDKISPEIQDLPGGTAFVVEFHPDVNPLDAIQLLSEQNLAVLPHPSLAANHFLVTGALPDVLALQDWDEVAYIFPASADLVSGTPVQLCLGAVSTSASGTGVGTAQYVVMGHGWPKDSSGKATVGYFFSALTPRAPQATVETEIERALSSWAAYAPLEFVPQTSATALQTINVWFASGDHGDGYPFTSDVLAHTFYPSNPEPIAGDMHLNLDEAWHTGSNIDIYTVALHEAGHALGLGHSDLPGAIMYPYYRLGAQIAAADIAGIQSIYGAVTAPAAPAPTANPVTVSISALPAQTGAATLAIAGTTSNGIGQTVVTWQTDHGASGRATGTGSWSAASVPLVTGSNTITVTATDGNHRTATQSVTVTRTVSAAVTTAPVSTSGPSIAITSPSLTILQTNQSSIALAGTASSTTAKVIWQNGPVGSGIATGTSSWSVTIPLLTGTNNLVVKALDSAGNSGWRSLTVVRR